MKEIIASANESGQRLDKLLKKYLKEAPGSFIYKMLRKKNIVLNDKKASGNEKIQEGDSIKLYLSDDTLQKFEGTPEKELSVPAYQLDIIYEDEHVLFVNKPAGMLSQKAAKDDISLVEYVTDYLLKTGKISQKELQTFKPAVCNRLDRNTSGLVVAGKSLIGLQTMAQLFKERTLKKYYLCVVKGKITETAHLKGFLTKDSKTNKVTVSSKGESYIETEYTPIAWNDSVTLLKVHLITGKTHQIRAHLSSTGHPIIGDYKYGDHKTNDKYKSKYHLSAQLLHAYEIEFPELRSPFEQISGQDYYAAVPEIFWKIIKEQTWQHGIQEALEVRH